ncbi:MAG: sigma-70 family RNA polymerase sigma factor [Deltaproteobacteria bacterium]|nr:sigma-70 family RNA polymerase sigma factor [Nannocystaceae bacterium]
MSNPSDVELLKAWRGGDNEAGNELVRRNFMSVYRFFVNKASDDVDDLIQRTFLACVEGRDRLRDDTSLKAYILGIARNQLLMHMRRRERRETPFGPEEMSVAAVYGSPSRVMAEREEEKLLLQALRQIPLDLQTIVELYYWEQLSVGEIAAILEVPAGTVKSRLFRARDAVREQLTAMDIPAQLQRTTIEGLEHWARALRANLDPAR